MSVGKIVIEEGKTEEKGKKDEKGKKEEEEMKKQVVEKEGLGL